MKNNMQNMFNAGSIDKELNEIKKVQKSPESYWTMLTNTCTDLYTVFCC